MMQIISDKLNMRRGALMFLDESTGRLRTEAAVGMTPDEIERGKYALGEGITGNVVATGRAASFPTSATRISSTAPAASPRNGQ
jgi:Nif-specific regulatory protein